MTMPSPEVLIGPLATGLVACTVALLALTTVRTLSRRAQARVADRAEAAFETWRSRRAEVHDDAPDPALLDHLNHRDEAVVERVVVGLFPRLDSDEQSALRSALVRHGAVERARRATRSRYGSRRAAAADLLGVAATRRALPELVALLGDPDATVRAAAARSLGKLGHPGAVPFLLAGVGAEASVPTGDASIAITLIGPPAVPGLRAGLALPSQSARRMAAELLGRFGAVDAVDDLCARMRTDTSPVVAAAAARALGRIEDPGVLDDLREVAESDRPVHVRQSAAWALGHLAALEGARW